MNGNQEDEGGPHPSLGHHLGVDNNPPLPQDNEDDEMMDFISFDKQPSDVIDSLLFNDESFPTDGNSNVNGFYDGDMITENGNGSFNNTNGNGNWIPSTLDEQQHHRAVSTQSDSPPPQQQNPQFNNNLSHESYRAAQDELSSLMFGRTYGPNTSNDDLKIDPYLPAAGGDLAQVIADYDNGVSSENCKFKLHLGDMPSKSRVETQIKCRLVVYSTPEEHLLHLPADTIARPKFQLRDPFVPSPNTLHLDVDVVSQTQPSKPVFMCSRCVNRERKRAFRKKNLDSNEEFYWNEERLRRLIIFNSKEVVPFSLAKSCDVGYNNIVEGKEIELPLRLACYCRHHSAKRGFRIIFSIKDYLGNVVARSISNPIQITDDHKEAKSSIPGTAATANSSLSTASSSSGPVPKPAFNWPNNNNTPNNTGGGSASNNTTPPSPASIAENESSEQFSDQSQKKRRRESEWNGSTRSFNTPTPQQQATFQAFNRPLSNNQKQNSQTSLSQMQQRTEIPSPQSSDNYQQMNSLNAVTSNSPSNNPNLPTIQRIIPAQGSIRGGIEITLLGTGFHSGLSATFGETKSMATHCWSYSTIVTQLPPATTPGPVVVSFEGYVLNSPQIFTYVDDTDRQLIELALQVVGLKMNGKLEDARNIARRIVGTNDNSGNNNNNNNNQDNNGGNNGMAVDSTDHTTVSALTSATLAIDDGDHEGFIVRCIELVCMSDDYGTLPQWQLKNFEGQTMLHLAALLGYTKVIIMLIAQGARVDGQDTNGMTPLHFAALHGHRKIVKKLLRAHADPFIRTSSGATVMDIAAASIMDSLPPVGINHKDYTAFNRNSSSSTLASIVSSEDGMDPDFVNNGGNNHRIPRVSNSNLSLARYYASEDGGYSSDYGFSDEDSEDNDPFILENERLNNNYNSNHNNRQPREQPANHRGNDLSAAQNISRYISQLSNNARNKIHDIGSWDDVLRYVKRRKDQTEIIVPTDVDSQGRSGSESDSTIIPQSPRRSENNISKVWHYFMPPIQETSSQSPPRYDEIFPDAAAEINNNANGGEKAAAESSSGGGVQQQESSSEISEETQSTQTAANRKQRNVEFVRQWTSVTDQRKEILNDRMLLFFWLPVLLLSIAFYVFRDNEQVLQYRVWVQQIGERIREYLTYLLLENKRPNDHYKYGESTALTVQTSESAMIISG